MFSEMCWNWYCQESAWWYVRAIYKPTLLA